MADAQPDGVRIRVYDARTDEFLNEAVVKDDWFVLTHGAVEESWQVWPKSGSMQVTFKRAKAGGDG